MRRPLASLLLFASAFCAHAVGKDAQRSVFPRSAVSWTIADFDGDGIPDLATIQQRLGSVSRSTVQISRPSETASIGVWDERQSFGLTLIARDLDNDNDLDLLVIDPQSAGSVQVWINDGKGGFREADPSQFSPYIDLNPVTAWRAGVSPFTATGLISAAGQSAGFGGASVSGPILAPSYAGTPRGDVVPASCTHRSLRARAPPRLFSSL